MRKARLDEAAAMNRDAHEIMLAQRNQKLVDTTLISSAVLIMSLCCFSGSAIKLILRGLPKSLKSKAQQECCKR